MKKKLNLRRQDMINRFEDLWKKIVSDPTDRPTVTEFARRAKTSVSNLYHTYPDLSEKIRIRRDENLPAPRRLSLVAQKKYKKDQETEFQNLVAMLRKENSGQKDVINSLSKHNELLKKENAHLKGVRQDNEKLRGAFCLIGDELRKYLDSQTANRIEKAIMDRCNKIKQDDPEGNKEQNIA